MKQYSPGKKLLFSIILLVFSVALVEASLHLFYAAIKHEAFPFSQYDDAIHHLATGQEEKQTGVRLAAGEMGWGKSTIEVIHPYLGFVLDPDKTPNVSYLGFPQENDDPFLETDDGSITVAIFGGSFAKGVSKEGESAMVSELLKHGINARILTVALGGYKQPQQLHALAYLLSQGALIDVVVNIDGFNEVALPAAENIPKGVHPFYPRAWYNRTIGLKDQETLRRMGRFLALQDDRQQWAGLFRDMPKYSITRNLVWRAYDKQMEKRVTDIHDRIRKSKSPAGSRFMVTGPNLHIDMITGLYQEIADHWVSTSLLMKALCDSRGIEYIHMLQPNQYFEAGRTLTSTEKKKAFRENHQYRPGVVNGYPELLAVKDELTDQGVNFHDLTMIYKDIPQPIYVDACCHPNDFGYDIVARYVADTIAETMKK